MVIYVYIYYTCDANSFSEVVDSIIAIITKYFYNLSYQFSCQMHCFCCVLQQSEQALR